MTLKVLVSLLLVFYSTFVSAQDNGYTQVIKRALKANRPGIAFSLIENKISSNNREHNLVHFSNLCDFLLKEYTSDSSSIRKYKEIESYLFSYLQKNFPHKCGNECLLQLIITQSYYMSPTKIFYKWNSLAKSTDLAYRVTLGGTFSLQNATKDLELSCKDITKKELNSNSLDYEAVIYFICNKILNTQPTDLKMQEYFSTSTKAYINTIQSAQNVSLPAPKMFIDFIIIALYEYKNNNITGAEEHLLKALNVANTLSQKTLASHGLFQVTKNKKYLPQLNNYLKYIEFNEKNDGLQHIIQTTLKNPTNVYDKNIFVSHSILKIYATVMFN